jgi:acyl-CoA thioester hydrolase
VNSEFDARTAPSPSDFPVLRTVPTRWQDNDEYGHVNNAEYYSYFDTAINGWLIDATGLDVRRLPAIGVVAETSCRYLREVSFPDVLLVGIACERLGQRSVVYQVGIYRAKDLGGDGPGVGVEVSGDAVAPAALGRFVHVYVDPNTRSTVPIPAPIRDAVEGLRAAQTDANPSSQRE